MAGEDALRKAARRGALSVLLSRVRKVGKSQARFVEEFCCRTEKEGNDSFGWFPSDILLEETGVLSVCVWWCECVCMLNVGFPFPQHPFRVERCSRCWRLCNKFLACCRQYSLTSHEGGWRRMFLRLLKHQVDMEEWVRWTSSWHVNSTLGWMGVSRSEWRIIYLLCCIMMPEKCEPEYILAVMN